MNGLSPSIVQVTWVAGPLGASVNSTWWRAAIGLTMRSSMPTCVGAESVMRMLPEPLLPPSKS
jgi:hypothetical protein